ncbi:MAG: hypothetical protein R2705_01845 [Ilumatobacteraceae bacterium]
MLLAVPALFPVLSSCGVASVESQGGGPPVVEEVPAPSGPDTSVPGESSGGALSHPTGAEDVVVRIANEGGFTTAQNSFGVVPQLLVTGDGTTYRPGAQIAISSGPAVADDRAVLRDRGPHPVRPRPSPRNSVCSVTSPTPR